jgi:hypothetical protein
MPLDQPRLGGDTSARFGAEMTTVATSSHMGHNCTYLDRASATETLSVQIDPGEPLKSRRGYLFPR